MRSQLVAGGLSISALGVFFLLLVPLFSIPVPFILSPQSGPAGTTVSATVIGLQPGSRVFLYWYGREAGDRTYYFLASADADQEGRVAGLTFTVPQAYEGVHNVTAATSPLGPAAQSIPAFQTAAVTLFNLTSTVGGEGTSGAPVGLSPLGAWGYLALAVGLALAGLGLVAKEKEGGVEAPEGQRFCPYCSSPVSLASERCPVCNGVQPREGA